MVIPGRILAAPNLKMAEGLLPEGGKWANESFTEFFRGASLKTWAAVDFSGGLSQKNLE